MFIDRGAAKPVVVALLAAACISILACEDPVAPRTPSPTSDSAEAVIDALARADRTRDARLRGLPVTLTQQRLEGEGGDA